MEISHSIHPVRQPNLNDCWAASLAMVLRLQGDDVVGDIKRRAVNVRLNRDGSMPPSSIPDLANATHTHIENMNSPLRPVTTSILRRVLGTSVAAAFGQYNYPGVPTSTMHVLLFYRMSGNDANPMVSLVDPYTGHRYSYLVSDINQALGSVDYFLYR